MPSCAGSTRCPGGRADRGLISARELAVLGLIAEGCSVRCPVSAQVPQVVQSQVTSRAVPDRPVHRSPAVSAQPANFTASAAAADVVDSGNGPRRARRGGALAARRRRHPVDSRPASRPEAGHRLLRPARAPPNVTPEPVAPHAARDLLPRWAIPRTRADDPTSRLAPSYPSARRRAVPGSGCAMPSTCCYDRR